jgi:L-amino acid N-acyltransferase YncA|tara:strand:- start:2301 stop:2747 length:447 start_codon:yes stop_codon:yes gene_type:complete
MKWRFFQKKDLYWIQEVSKDFLKESAWGNRVEINKEKVINYFFAAMNKPNMFGIVSLKKEEPTGFMIGCLLEFPYSKDKFAKQLELYVVPKERGKMTGIQMMKKFIDWSKIQGAQEVIFDVSTQVGSFDKLAQRLGMEEIGKSYRKIL